MALFGQSQYQRSVVRRTEYDRAVREAQNYGMSKAEADAYSRANAANYAVAVANIGTNDQVNTALSRIDQQRADEKNRWRAWLRANLSADTMQEYGAGRLMALADQRIDWKWDANARVLIVGYWRQQGSPRNK